MINVAELLKDCPRGMALDCVLFDDVKFEECAGECIYIRLNNGEEFALTEYGNCLEFPISKCIIFPKGKTTWEGFKPPCKFKDGDILATDLGCVFYLNTRLNTDKCYGCYAGIGSGGHFHTCEPFAYKECCGLATEEEKQKLFDVIKANGYKWNAETKTLEKLVEPKFDITTLKPFDKVLVRGDVGQRWVIDFFGFMDSNKGFPFVCVGHYVIQCIPYEGNEHLLGTTDDCNGYYKNWKTEILQTQR